jgi:RNase P/RNase MRP subunit p30
MISVNKIEQAKNLIKKAEKENEKPIIVKAQDYEFNRKILEYGKFDILLNIEQNANKRKIRQIDSGFNHVLGKIASKNSIKLGIDLDYIRNLPKKEQALYLEKLIQNIKVARKAKTKIIALNCKDKKNAMDFMISLGASSQQAKQAIDF